MEGVETASRVSVSPEQHKEEPTKHEPEAVLYPTLRGMDEDGDAKMPGDGA
jgi:hypothetical protein